MLTEEVLDARAGRRELELERRFLRGDDRQGFEDRRMGVIEAAGGRQRCRVRQQQLDSISERRIVGQQP
jgi:hypothetical protein